MKLALITLFLISTPYLLMECGESINQVAKETHVHTSERIYYNANIWYDTEICETLSDSVTIEFFDGKHRELK